MITIGSREGGITPMFTLTTKPEPAHANAKRAIMQLPHIHDNQYDLVSFPVKVWETQDLSYLADIFHRKAMGSVTVWGCSHDELAESDDDWYHARLTATRGVHKVWDIEFCVPAAYAYRIINALESLQHSSCTPQCINHDLVDWAEKGGMYVGPSYLSMDYTASPSIVSLGGLTSVDELDVYDCNIANFANLIHAERLRLGPRQTGFSVGRALKVTSLDLVEAPSLLHLPLGFFAYNLKLGDCPLSFLRDRTNDRVDAVTTEGYCVERSRVDVDETLDHLWTMDLSVCAETMGTYNCKYENAVVQARLNGVERYKGR